MLKSGEEVRWKNQRGINIPHFKLMGENASERVALGMRSACFGMWNLRRGLHITTFRKVVQVWRVSALCSCMLGMYLCMHQGQIICEEFLIFSFHNGIYSSRAFICYLSYDPKCELYWWKKTASQMLPTFSWSLKIFAQRYFHTKLPKIKRASI